MRQLVSNFHICDSTGSELWFDKDYCNFCYISSEGIYGRIHGVAVDELKNSGEICYLHVPGLCVFLIGECEKRLQRFDFFSAVFETVTEVERTEEISEGYDYCEFRLGPSGHILFYDMGACCFETNGSVVWKTPFEGMLVFPKIMRTKAVYEELSETYQLSLIDGRLSKWKHGLPQHS